MPVYKVFTPINRPPSTDIIPLGGGRMMALGMLGGGTVPSSLLSGLVSYWKMDETSTGAGAITRNDSVGTNHLVDNNTVLSADGIIGNAANFSAANSESLSVNDNAELSMGAGISFEMALWFNQQSAAYAMVFSKYGEYYLDVYNIGNVGVIKFWGRKLDNSGAIQVATGTGVNIPGTMMFVLCGYDALLDKIFIKCNDGEIIYSGLTLGGGIYNGIAALNFACRPGADYFSGLIDEVGIWKNRVLTASERVSLWNGGTGITHPF